MTLGKLLTQMILNTAARLVVGLGKYEHITAVLRDVIHWLPVPQRIQFKIAALTFDCVRGTGPAYFSSIACTVADNSGRHGLRSAERGDLFVPGGAFSSQLQLSGTHCRFIFAPRPSVAVSFEQGSRLIFSGWPFTDFSSENY